MQPLTFESFIQNYIVEPNLQMNKSEEALLSAPLLKREATRRGWTVSELTPSLFHLFSNGKLIGGAHNSIPSIVSDVAVGTSNQKHASKIAFTNAGLPVAGGRHFRVEEYDEAAEYFSSAPKPVVVKASRGLMGSSVSVNVSTLEDFEKAWAKASKGKGLKAFNLVEQQVDGIDIRAYVVDGEVCAAVTRVPAFVIGDGESTVSELLENLLAKRKANAYMRSMPVRVDTVWLKGLGLDRESVVAPGEVLTLNRTTNTHQGAFNFAITPLLSKGIIDLAVQAADAIPGLRAVGMDLMVKSLDSAEGATLVEANANGSLLLHHYPAYGEAVNLAARILDAMEKN